MCKFAAIVAQWVAVKTYLRAFLLILPLKFANFFIHQDNAVIKRFMRAYIPPVRRVAIIGMAWGGLFIDEWAFGDASMVIDRTSSSRFRFIYSQPPINKAGDSWRTEEHHPPATLCL